MSKKKTNKSANGVGRPSKFNPDQLDEIRNYVYLGATDLQIAEFLGISESTYHLWKKEYPEFSESLKDWKVTANAMVEKSLYHRAIGYEHPAIHFASYQGKVTETEYVEHYPPDTRAGEYWLNNRDPERWKNKQHIDVDVAPIGVGLLSTDEYKDARKEALQGDDC